VEVALEGGGSVVLYTEEMKSNLATHAQDYLNGLDDIPEQIRKVLEGFAIGRYPVGYVKAYPDIAG
jgi:hypothetical protein